MLFLSWFIASTWQDALLAQERSPQLAQPSQFLLVERHGRRFG
jgi:hypothetical protein